jgi:hypothetical protein
MGFIIQPSKFNNHILGVCNLKTSIQTLTIIVLLGIIIFLGLTFYQKLSIPSLQSEQGSIPQTQISGKTSANEEQFNGTVALAMDYKVDYAEDTLGYSFKQEIKHETYNTSVYGAKNAQIEVSDSTGNIIGLFNADNNGDFSFIVKKDDFYQLHITFQDTEKKLTVRANEISGLNIYLGYLNVATGNWEK